MAAVLSPHPIPVIGFQPFLEGNQAGKARLAREIARACTPREFADFIRRETGKWGRIARENNLRAD